MNPTATTTPIQWYEGSVSFTAGKIAEDQRLFADGNYVLRRRLEAIQSSDPERIQEWCEKYITLADLCVTTPDTVKVQHNSGFLTGLRGGGEIDDKYYVLVDADSVRSAITPNGWELFKDQYCDNARFPPQVIDGRVVRIEIPNVVLFPHTHQRDLWGHYTIGFTPDQFEAIDAEGIPRRDIPQKNHFSLADITRNGEIIHPMWKIYGPDVIVPLFSEALKLLRIRDHGEGCMGFSFLDKGEKVHGSALMMDALYDPAIAPFLLGALGSMGGEHNSVGYFKNKSRVDNGN